MKTNAQRLLQSMPPGEVMRRAVLASWTTAVDRDIKRLEEEGLVRKAGPGLYYKPEISRFGPQPPTPPSVVEAFLKDERFLIVNPADYNSLGLGLTQLHNFTWVYNRKRFGDFVLGGQNYYFRRPPDFPEQVDKNYLLVDLLNNFRFLGEDEEVIRNAAANNANKFNAKNVLKYAKYYGKVGTRKFLLKVFGQ